MNNNRGIFKILYERLPLDIKKYVEKINESIRFIFDAEI
jgi:hypothetical protein